jgi:putative Ca2+/H+ antiporter (TMEM165/GDT1 family)
VAGRARSPEPPPPRDRSVLKPDTLDDDRRLRGTGVFLSTLIAFFLVEMGDKTQLATVALAARYPSLVQVVMGTTLGMMLANVPAVWLGQSLAHRVNMKAVRWLAALLFIALGVLTLFAADHAVGGGRTAPSAGVPAR